MASWHKRFKWKHCYPITVMASNAHWGEASWTPDGVYDDDCHESLRGKPKFKGVQHDEAPKTWPWWRLFGFCYCNLNMTPPTRPFGIHPPSSGRRLWIYTRWGSLYIDVVIDRRGIC